MTERKIDVIGSTDIVDFPELGIIDVPVKVDTGADSSSIWASDIQVTPEGLHFTMFGKGSRLYTGESMMVDDFRISSVKNSFGTAEFRYKVNLLVRIGDRRIHGWFTLSDRKNMKYPVLLGRRLLKSKFLVDVSKSKVHAAAQADRRVLILNPITTRLPQFVKEVSADMKSGAKVDAQAYDDLAFRLETNKTSVKLPNGKDISQYDLIYFKSHKQAYSQAIAVARYAAYHHIPFFDREIATNISYDKLSEMMVLSTHGLPVVSSLTAKPDQLEARANEAAKEWGWPLVCKEITAARGKKNYMLHSAADLAMVQAKAEPTDIYLIQRYIPNDGYLRLLVLGHEVAMAVQRKAVENVNPLKEHLNNPHGGVNATLLESKKVPPDAYELAIRSATLLGRQVAGVDLLQDKNTKEWYILEVNNAPQLIDGAFPEEKRRVLAKFIDFEIDR